MSELLIGLSILLVSVFWSLAWLYLCWRDARLTASLLFVEINEIVETSVMRDYVGALYGYQSHLAAGHRMKIPERLGFETIVTPVFSSSLNRLAALGASQASEVAEFYAGLQRMKHDMKCVIGDDVTAPESVAEWLGEDIRLWGELEMQGASLLVRLRGIAETTFFVFAKKMVVIR